MSELSAEQAAKARKIESQVLQGIARLTQSTVAKALGCDDATINRLKETHLSRFAEICVLLDLKMVSGDSQVITHEDKRALMRMARDYLEAELSHDEMVSGRKKDD